MIFERQLIGATAVVILKEEDEEIVDEDDVDDEKEEEAAVPDEAAVRNDAAVPDEAAVRNDAAVPDEAVVHEKSAATPNLPAAAVSVATTVMAAAKAAVKANKPRKKRSAQNALVEASGYNKLSKGQIKQFAKDGVFFIQGKLVQAGIELDNCLQSIEMEIRHKSERSRSSYWGNKRLRFELLGSSLDASADTMDSVTFSSSSSNISSSSSSNISSGSSSSSNRNSSSSRSSNSSSSSSNSSSSSSSSITHSTPTAVRAVIDLTEERSTSKKVKAPTPVFSLESQRTSISKLMSLSISAETDPARLLLLRKCYVATNEGPRCTICCKNFGRSNYLEAHEKKASHIDAFNKRLVQKKMQPAVMDWVNMRTPNSSLPAETKEFRFAFTKMVMGLNIPMSKADVIGDFFFLRGEDVQKNPDHKHLAKDYVPLVHEFLVDQIRNRLKTGIPFSVFHDGCTNGAENFCIVVRYVLNGVIFQDVMRLNRCSLFI